MTPQDGDASRRELTGKERALLCELADPEGEPPDAAIFEGLDALAILRAARDHKVEPVVLRKFRQAGVADRPDLGDYCRAATRDRMYITAVALALNAQVDRITAGFTAAGVPHAVVKGAAFATAIYPDPAERPFSDIDILLPPSARRAASRVMESLEFELFSRDFLDQSDAKQEQQWGYRGDTAILAELHTDMVHAPTLRRRISFGHEAYERASAAGASSTWRSMHNTKSPRASAKTRSRTAVPDWPTNGT